MTSRVNGAGLLPPEDFIKQIWEGRGHYVRERRIKQPHPWRVALSEQALAAARFRWQNQETRHDIVYRYFVADEN